MPPIKHRRILRELVPGLIGVVVVIVLIPGIVMLAVAWGFWTGKLWTWTFAIVFRVVALDSAKPATPT